ncbi:MAG: hypothetical protein NVSMB14_16910 [Isosphaeraceae bacterium]
MTDEECIIEFSRLRDRFDAEIPRSTQLRSGAKSPAIVGQIFAQSSLPNATGRFFAAHPVDVLGQESEGQPGAFRPNLGATFFVDVIGSRVPSVGDLLVCRFVGDRWVAESSFAAMPPGVNLSGCSCLGLPTTLYMTSANPSCNGGMFQSCTIVYQTTPVVYSALNLGAQCFLSSQSFIDLNNNTFQYYFYCQGNQFNLGRVYASSLYGSPYLDPARYIWKIGSTSPGNTCWPLLLTNGQIFVGGDSTCSVTISA